MLSEKLNRYTVILASGSPRRQKFFEELGINFEVRKKNIDEVYPAHLTGSAIPRYLAQLKADAFKDILEPHQILITADTVVWHNNKSIGKPRDLQEAKKMLSVLSGSCHEVITAVCFTTLKEQITVHDCTQVLFKDLDDEEIHYYTSTFNPLDKAGAYGIQEWIGLIGVKEIQGSYYNVMGMPTHLVYKTLMSMAD